MSDDIFEKVDEILKRSKGAFSMYVNNGLVYCVIRCYAGKKTTGKGFFGCGKTVQEALEDAYKRGTVDGIPGTGIVTSVGKLTSRPVHVETQLPGVNVTRLPGT